MKPRLLDLFCGAGGASVGYHRAGFEVGVDLAPQPNYPFRFVRFDAMTYPLDGFNVIHASPPCQAYSALRNLGKQENAARFYFIEAIRERLVASGVPYVIENVVGAPLKNPVTICGSSFGLGVRRHRLFEASFPIVRLPCAHAKTSIGVYGDHPQISKGMNRAHTLAQASEAMGIHWMAWQELCEAIPPAYTEHIGAQILATIGSFEVVP